MRFLAVFIGIAGGWFGAKYAYPHVAPYANLALGETDYLPVAPLGAAPSGAPAGGGTPVKMVLQKASGKVLRLSLAGEWVPLGAGEFLVDGEQLKTEADSTALLATERGGPRMEVADLTQVALRQLTTASHRFRLMSGFVSLKYQGPRPEFSVESRSGQTVLAGTGDATFLADGGRIDAACHAGSLAAQAKGKSVAIAAGHGAAARDGEVPERADKSPARVDLTVDDPGAAAAGARTATITGSASPHARVVVGGVVAFADAKGRFSAKTPLKEGDNRFTAVARDAAGNEKKLAVPPITVAPTAKTAAAPALTPSKRAPPKPKAEGMQWGAR